MVWISRLIHQNSDAVILECDKMGQTAPSMQLCTSSSPISPGYNSSSSIGAEEWCDEATVETDLDENVQQELKQRLQFWMFSVCECSFTN
jgi:hypothetical protein